MKTTYERFQEYKAQHPDTTTANAARALNVTAQALYSAVTVEKLKNRKHAYKARKRYTKKAKQEMHTIEVPAAPVTTETVRSNLLMVFVGNPKAVIASLNEFLG